MSFKGIALLTQREALAGNIMHINDVKAICGIKSYLQSHLHSPHDIASLAKNANMSEPKMRKFFKQIFGK